jgi:hypothetical protein
MGRVSTCVGLPKCFTTECTENTDKNLLQISVNSVFFIIPFRGLW